MASVILRRSFSVIYFSLCNRRKVIIKQCHLEPFTGVKISGYRVWAKGYTFKVVQNLRDFYGDFATLNPSK